MAAESSGGSSVTAGSHAAGSHATSDPDPGAAAPGPATPHIGRFAVLGAAGAGAMGVVYAAYDPTLDRRVALKVLRGGATRGRERDRIRREALALARVNHPNVVSVYEVGEADGRLFIAMEYVDGPELESWLASRAHDWRAVVAIFAQVGRGLAAAHDQDLVHRDFKPSNVLVGRDERPRIIDFGLARAADGADDSVSAIPISGDAALLSSPLTRTGHLLGTPAYMAPEVLAGAPPTAASDQFAFCVALFESLYGVPPFPRDSLLMLRASMVRGELAVPARGAAPREILTILRRGLAAEPTARWPSMTALLQAIDSVDGVRHDDARGWRIRAAMAALTLAVIGVDSVVTLVRGPPSDGWAMVRGELGLTVGPMVFLVVFRRWFSAEEMSRRLRIWIVHFVVIRLAAAGIGAHLALNVDQLYAIDTVIIAGMVAFLRPYVGMRNPLALASMLAALAGIAVAPAHTVVLHHVAGLVMVLLVIRSNWALIGATARRLAAKGAP